MVRQGLEAEQRERRAREGKGEMEIWKRDKRLAQNRLLA